MLNFFFNAVCGLKLSYYLRHFIFGGLFAALMLYVMTRNGNILPFTIYVFMAISAILYPYARFVYELIIEFIMGDTIIISAALFLLFYKLIIMAIIFPLSIVIAPVGMIIVGILKSKNQQA